MKHPDDAFQEGKPPRRRPANREGSRQGDWNDDDDSDRPYRRRTKRDRDDDALSALIPYRNAMALAAYYCGVFGLLPVLGVILGPIAVVLGILGLNQVRAHPEAKGTGHAITGILLGSLTLFCHIGVLFAVLIAG